MEWKYYLLNKAKDIKLTEAELLVFNPQNYMQNYMLSVTGLGDEIFSTGEMFDECLFWRVAHNLELNTIYIEDSEIYIQQPEVSINEVPGIVEYWLRQKNIPVSSVNEINQSEVPVFFRSLFDNFVLN